MATQGIPIPEGASIGVPIPQGASVGEPSPQQTQALPPGQIPLTSHTAATLQGLANVGSGVIDAGKGLLQAFNPKPQPGENAFTASPAGRILKGAIGALSGAPQVPGAISDLAQNGKLLSTVGEIAGNAGGQLVTGAAIDQAPGAVADAITAPSTEVAARVGGKVAAGLAEDIPGVRQVKRIGRYYKEATAETTARRGGSQSAPSQSPAPETSQPQSASPNSSSPSGQDSTGQPPGQQTQSTQSTSPKASAQSVPSQKSSPVITDTQQIKSTLDEILKKPEKANGSTAPKAKSAATQQKIADETADLRNRKTQVSGEDIDPEADLTDFLKQSLQRLGKGEAGQAGMPGAVSNLDEGIADIKSRPVLKSLEGEVPARGFLNQAGADEKSVLQSQADHDTVQYHRGQLDKGTSKPVELHLDEKKNVIGADGRHRAVAAIQRGGPNAKVKVRVIMHPFERVQ